MMKKTITLLLAACLLVLTLVGCGQGNKENSQNSSAAAENSEKEAGAAKINENDPVVRIEMENGSVIRMELFPEDAPITVENFLKLVNEGFYNGIMFHRVEKGFVVQGGDPQGDGYGGPGYSITGEFEKNGIKNTISHENGVVSMARSAYDYNSAGSQFFICLGDQKFLDGQYAAFGKVIEGMDAVNNIQIGDVMKNVTVE